MKESEFSWHDFSPLFGPFVGIGIGYLIVGDNGWLTLFAFAGFWLPWLFFYMPKRVREKEDETGERYSIGRVLDEMDEPIL